MDTGRGRASAALRRPVRHQLLEHSAGSRRAAAGRQVVQGKVALLPQPGHKVRPHHRRGGGAHHPPPRHLRRRLVVEDRLGPAGAHAETGQGDRDHWRTHLSNRVVVAQSIDDPRTQRPMDEASTSQSQQSTTVTADGDWQMVPLLPAHPVEARRPPPARDDDSEDT